MVVVAYDDSLLFVVIQAVRIYNIYNEVSGHKYMRLVWCANV